MKTKEEIKRDKELEEEDSKRRRENDEADARRSSSLAMGDMLNTGIPGGIDMDFTTPL